MALNLRQLASGMFSRVLLNSNFEKIENKVNDDLVHRQNGSAQMQQDLDMNNNSILNLGDPTGALGVATKSYVDTQDNAVLSAIQNIEASGTIRQESEEFTATQGQTVFTLTTTTFAGEDTLAVYVNGVRQSHSAYTTSSANVITFSEALQDGDKVLFTVNESTSTTLTASQVSYQKNGNTDVDGALDNVYETLATLTVDTIADLLNVAPSTSTVVNVLNYHSGIEGGGGVFYWDATRDCGEHNGGTIIASTAQFPPDWLVGNQQLWFAPMVGTGCWIRQYDGAVNVKWFGAIGDGVSDDTLAIQKVLDTAWRSVGLTIDLGSKENTYLLTSKLYFYNAYKAGVSSDRGFKLVGNNAVLKATHSDVVLDIQGAFKCVLDGFKIDGSGTASVGLLVSGANNTTLTDNGGTTGSGYRSEHFTINNVETNDCATGAKFGDGNDQLDYVTVSNCYFKGNSYGCYVEQGNTYVTFIETAAHGNYQQGAIGFRVDNGQAKFINCYAFASDWAFDINSSSPIYIQGFEGENLVNGVRYNYSGGDDWEVSQNLRISDSMFYLTDTANIGLDIAKFIGVVIENSYFTGKLYADAPEIRDFEQALYQETNTYFASRDDFYLASVPYKIVAAKDGSGFEQVEHLQTVTVSNINQNLIENSRAGGASTNNATFTSSNAKFLYTPNKAHTLALNNITSASGVWRGGIEYWASGYSNANVSDVEIEFGVWMRVAEGNVADTITGIEIMANDTTSYTSTNINRIRPRLTRKWQYFYLYVDTGTISNRLNFLIRNLENSAKSVEIALPRITLGKGISSNYLETSGTSIA
jgi:hypothetical protein